MRSDFQSTRDVTRFSDVQPVVIVQFTVYDGRAASSPCETDNWAERERKRGCILGRESVKE